jgi:pimeloyl-ACP methyl ester carboxylesterase
MPDINSTDTKIHYQIWGKGDPLLLIHGLGSSSRDWELQIPEFSQQYQVIGLDLRGHGVSGKPPGPYSIPLFAEDTVRLLRKLDAVPAHVLGISLGGMVAFQLAVDFPDLTRSLIVVNSTPSMIPRSIWDKVSLLQRLLIIRLFGLRKMGQVLAERFFPYPEQDGLKEIFIQRWAENHRPSYLEALKAVAGWSVKDRLGEIQAPTLVLGADQDYFPLEEKIEYAGLIPDSRVVIVEDSRHALPAEKPKEFNRIVLDFLAGIP